MRPILIIAAIVLILLSLHLGSVQAAECGDAWVFAEDVSIEKNSTDYFYFTFYNDGDERFTVVEARAGIESGSFEIALTGAPGTVGAESEGELTVRVKTLNNSSSGTAYVEIGGRFADGETCYFSEIERAYFEVTIESNGGNQTAECGEVLIHANNVTMAEDSTKIVNFSIENTANKDFDLYDIAVEETSSYFNATLYSKPSKINKNESETFRVRIESESVNSNSQGSVSLKARGQFANGPYCAYSDIALKSFTVTVENAGTQPSSQPQPGNECPDIALDKHIVRVAQGETVYTTFQLRNFARENFLVDYISIFDGSNNFKAEQNGYAKVIPASGSAFVNVKVQAHDFAVPGRENAFVEVKGHFQNQESCSLSGNDLNTFEVIIEEKGTATESATADFTQDECSTFSLIAPVSMKIDGNGSVPIVIVNKAYSRATILLYGPSLSINPSFISVAENSTVSEGILVESKLPQSTLVFTVDSPLCKTEKRTVIINTKIAAPVAPAEKPVPINPVDGAIKSVQGAIAAGFAVLNQNLALVGLVILIAIILYFIIKK